MRLCVCANGVILPPEKSPLGNLGCLILVFSVYVWTLVVGGGVQGIPSIISSSEIKLQLAAFTSNLNNDKVRKHTHQISK